MAPFLYRRMDQALVDYYLMCSTTRARRHPLSGIAPAALDALVADLSALARRVADGMAVRETIIGGSDSRPGKILVF